MNELIALLFIISSVGVVGESDESSVSVTLSGEQGSDLLIEIPTLLIPCKVSSGDKIYIEMDSKSTKILCNKSNENTKKVDVKIRPITGEIEYIIRGVEVDLK